MFRWALFVVINLRVHRELGLGAFSLALVMIDFVLVLPYYCHATPSYSAYKSRLLFIRLSTLARSARNPLAGGLADQQGPTKRRHA